MARRRAMALGAWTAAVLAAGGGACALEVGTFAGKSCATASDCPQPYVCVFARGAAEGPTCELLRPPRIEESNLDGPVDYCHDIKPILDRSCLSNCHGANITYPSAPNGFRLDYYEPPTPGGTPGVKSEADAVVNRSVEDTMPPFAAAEPRISSSERALMSRWLRNGAPECLDGGTPDGG